MYAYPTTLTDEISVALSPLMTGKINTSAEAQACWAIVGYGLAQALPPAPPNQPKFAAHELGPQLSAAAGAPHTMKALPWQQIVAILMQLIQLWQASGGTTPSS